MMMNDCVHRDRRGDPLLPVLLLSLAGFVAAMIFQSARWRADGAATQPLAVLGPYWAAFALGWLGLSAFVWEKTRGDDGGGGPPAASGPGGGRGRAASSTSGGRHEAWAVWVILGVALLTRAAVVLGCQPRLSDDIWRYLFDGRTLAAGQNPYARPPAATLSQARKTPVGRETGSAGDPLARRVNNPGLVTIYQPVSQGVFAALWELSKLGRPGPRGRGEAWGGLAGGAHVVFRMGLTGCDMLVIGLLLWGLRDAGRSPWWAVLYAWHPLAISEVGGAGHQDVLGIAALLAALLLARRVVAGGRGEHMASPRPPGGWGHGVGAGICFAAALAVKPIVLPLAAVLAWKLRSRPRLVIASAGAALLGLAVFYTPFALMPGGLSGMFHTARTFVHKWAFNGSFHTLAMAALGDKQRADLLCAVLLAALLVAVIAAGYDLIVSSMIYLFGALLLSSTAHPWYLLWALALLPLCIAAGARPALRTCGMFSPTGPPSGPYSPPKRVGGVGLPNTITAAVWVWTLTIPLAYTAFLNARKFKPFDAALFVEYVPVYAVLGHGVWRALRRRVLQHQGPRRAG